MNRYITRAKQGNKKAFEKLIESYGEKLYGYIYNRVMDKYSVEDTFQDVWIKVYERLHTFDEAKEFSPWLLRIARNQIVDNMRSRKLITMPIYDYEAVDGVCIEDLYIAKESAMYLDMALAELKESYYSVIVMRYFDELSYSDIARKLDIEVKEVKWRLYESKKQLARIYTEKEGKRCRAR